MSDKVDLRLFTAAQIADWLEHGTQYDGLSEWLIDKQRALALVSNPFVKGDMSLISALYVNDSLAAYTCVFPDSTEKPEGKTIYWFTTLYVGPKYEGRGYGYIVLAQICELYEGVCFDLDAAKATVEILKYQGFTLHYLTHYLFKNKSIHRNNIKGRLSYISNKIHRMINTREKELREEIRKSRYTLQYVSQIDDEIYGFIKGHSSQDVFLRKKETFNWILQHPFMQESPVRRRCKKKCRFSSIARVFRLYGVVVREKEEIVGFLILRSTNEEWSVKYIYYKDGASRTVYYAVAEHLLSYPRLHFYTADKGLHDFIVEYNLYDHDTIYKKSFACPPNFNYDGQLHIQAGDGDNVT